jgi:hypothetical protein
VAPVTDVAATDGLELRLDRAQRGNRFDAHRLLHLGAAEGVQAVLAAGGDIRRGVGQS